jgi:hypothetical protein
MRDGSAGTTVEFGVMDTAVNFFTQRYSSPDEPYEGILGLGYAALATANIVPWFDRFAATHPHVGNIFALKLCSDGARASLDSTMVLGNPESLPGATALFGNRTFFAPLVHEAFYSIYVTSMSVGSDRLPLPCGAYNSPGPSIVDSGTTNIIVPQAVHTALVARVPMPSALSADAVSLFFAGKACLNLTTAQLTAMPEIAIGLEVGCIFIYIFIYLCSLILSHQHHERLGGQRAGGAGAAAALPARNSDVQPRPVLLLGHSAGLRPGHWRDTRDGVYGQHLCDV